MASDQVQYNHRKTKSDEQSDTAAATATDRGLFGFGGKKEEDKKCEEEVVAGEFDRKAKVSDEKKGESNKHESLLEKLHRSNSSSSSSSEEEVEENGEKKKKKKEKKEKIDKCEDDKPAEDTESKKGFLDKIKEKLPGGKKAEDVASPPPTPTPTPAAESATSPGGEKKGLMDKIKEKIPGYSKSDEEKEKEKGNECK